MSDTSENQELEIAAELPPQVSPSDTSNQDDKVSVDPSGEKYIRTTE